MKKLLWVFTVVVGVVVGGCADDAAEAPAGVANQDAANSAVIEAAKAIVEYTLIDPGSAQYRNLLATAAGSVCGEVNAKNQLGGYTGFQPFIVDSEGVEFDPSLTQYKCVEYPLEEVSLLAAAHELGCASGGEPAERCSELKQTITDLIVLCKQLFSEPYCDGLQHEQNVQRVRARAVAQFELEEKK